MNNTTTTKRTTLTAIAAILMAATLVVGGTLAVTTTAAIRPAYAITFGSTKNLSNNDGDSLIHKYRYLLVMYIPYGKIRVKETVIHSLEEAVMLVIAFIAL
jgi:hypothetical protein